jgi:5'(3')-deoxyribonucleotidase
MFNNVILLDMDGVLANFVDGVIASLGVYEIVSHDDWASWDYHRELGFTDEQMWAPTREPGWWEALDPYPWAGELVEYLRSSGFKVVFCTSPSTDCKCPMEKVNWLRKHGLMDRNKNDYQMGPMKELNAMSGAILIDDSDTNVEKYEKAAGRAILFPQPWNRNRLYVGWNAINFVERVGIECPQ